MKKCISWLLVWAMLLLSLMPVLPTVSAAELTGTETAGGKFGYLTWSYEPGTGALTVSGNGPMPVLSSSSSYPWHSLRSSIRSAEIRNGVTTIGYDAFYDCYYLTSVSIPDSVTTIGHYAFYRCTGLTSVTIGNSVTAIGNYAFCNCYGLTSVTIGNSVTTIGSEAFLGCTGLTSVELPYSVKYVYSNAFVDCWNMESITFYNRNCSISSSLPVCEIYGWRGSTAETYADRYALVFHALDDTHVHEYTTTTIPATCTAKGGIKHTCLCGDEYYGNEVPALGHTDADSNGYCERCGKRILQTIRVGETKQVSLSTNTDGYYHQLEFTPTATGTYEFRTSYASYCYIRLSDGAQRVIASDSYYYSSGSITCRLVKGNVYTFFAGNGDFDNYYIDVSLNAVNIECDHLHTVNVPAQAATCSEPGYTAGVYCEDCEFYLSGHKILTVKHSDEDSDGYCDACGFEFESHIRIGETKYINLGSTTNGTYLRINAEKSGTYRLSATRLYYVDVSLRDGNYNYLYEDYIYYGSLNTTQHFDKGRSYYLSFYSYDWNDFYVSFDVVEYDCDHLHTKTVSAEEATCTADGYTQGVYCEDCGEWISGHELIPLFHTDADNDSFCDKCGEELLLASGIATDGTLWWKLRANGTLEVSGEGDLLNVAQYYGYSQQRPEHYDNIYLPYYDYAMLKNEDGSYPNKAERYYYSPNNNGTYIEYAGNVEGYSDADPYAYYSSMTDGYYDVRHTARSDVKNLKADGTFDISYYEDYYDYEQRSNLESIEFTEDSVIRSFSNYAFSNCPALQKVVLPANVTEIPAGAFSRCSSLTEINIPESVTNIGAGAFARCSSLTEITVNNKNTTVTFDTTTIPEATVIHCPHDSSVFKYAVSFNRAYVLTDAHNFVLTLSVPAGCAGYGFNMYECSCGEKKTETISPTGHVDENGDDLCDVCKMSMGGCAHHFTTKTVLPTCTKDGYITLTCTVCRYSVTETLNATGHNYVDFVIEPTCTADGFTKHYCVNCGDELLDSPVKALGHSLRTQTITPTCTEQGCDIMICETCSYNYEANVVAAAGHKAMLVNAFEADKFIEGYTGDIVCSVCHELLEAGKVIPALGEGGEDVPQVKCTHLCHKTGILGFFWKVINLFNKLFKINQYCECGAAHW